MELFDELKKKVTSVISEMELDTEKSRGQDFLEVFQGLREHIEDAKNAHRGNAESKFGQLLDLLNRKGEENDMEP